MRDPANSSEPDSNHYAFPLPISPVIECTEYKVVRIDTMPTGADNTIKPPAPYQPTPANEYIPEAQELRKDLKPLRVLQPEGASFTVTPVGETGHVLEWQKWNFFIGKLAHTQKCMASTDIAKASISAREWCYTTSNTTADLCSTDYPSPI